MDGWGISFYLFQQGGGAEREGIFFVLATVLLQRGKFWTSLRHFSIILPYFHLVASDPHCAMR